MVRDISVVVMAPLTDEEAEERLRSMEAIIDNEAAMKVASLRRREGDLPRQKAMHVRRGIDAICAHYKKLEKKVEDQTKICVLRVRNSERLELLAAKEAMVKKVLEEVRQRLRNLAWDNVNLHRKVFAGLILQGLVKMLEPRVLLVVRPSDAKVAATLLPLVMESFHATLAERIPREEASGSFGARLAEPLETLQAVMEPDLGGVILVSEGGTIVVDNTLGKRFDMMAYDLMPQLKHVLFKAILRAPEVPAFDPKYMSCQDLHRRSSSKSLFRYSYISYPPNNSYSSSSSIHMDK